MHKKQRNTIALSISLVYLIISVASRDPIIFVEVLASVSAVLMLIVFNNEMGSYKGFYGGSTLRKVDRKSPPEIVAFMG